MGVTVEVGRGTARSAIATPPAPTGGLGAAFSDPTLGLRAARLGAALASRLDRPLRIGARVFVVRHHHIREVLARDLEFRIGPVNAARINAVNGPFVLGMDRDVRLGQARAALYTALAKIDLDSLRLDLERSAMARAGSGPGSLDIVADYARPLAAATAMALFGVKGPDLTTFCDVARAIFAHTFLNLGGDSAIEARAVAAAALMRSWIEAEIAARSIHQPGVDFIGRLLSAGLDPDEVRRTTGGMLVGSIDTTATAVAKIVTVIGRDPGLKAQVAADVDDRARLAGWCRETLRRWPHNPILLRRAVADTRLAGTAVKAGDAMVLWTHAAMFDAAAFPSPATLRPDRPERLYLHFGGGLHPCAGRAVNAFQLPALVGALVRRGITAVGRIGWAGPFPDHLTVRFGR